MYFAARHTDIDCWNKRGHKGYLFIIGDEMAYGKVKKTEVMGVMADGLEQDIPLKIMVKELQQRYHVFYLLPQAASYGGDGEILDFWRGLLGQHVLELEKSEAVCETIALAIGMTEGTIDLPAGLRDLDEFNVPETVMHTVEAALKALPVSQTAERVSGLALPGLNLSRWLGSGK